MPIYQYECPKCKLQFELKQSFSDDPTVACPKCQNGARRLFSPTSIIFKGSGFYVTDSRGDGSAARGGEDSKEQKKVSEKVDGKTDDNTDQKTDEKVGEKAGEPEGDKEDKGQANNEKKEDSRPREGPQKQ